jgi:O-antigen/teichoic acid export membrane protein
MIILKMGLFFSLSENICAHLLFGVGKHRLNVWCTGAEALLNLTISLLFVRRFGIYGVAIGTTLAALLIRGWFFPNAVLKVFHVRWAEFLEKSVFPTIIPTLAFAAGALSVRHFVPVHNYPTLLLSLAAGLLFYIPFLWLFGFAARERKELRAYLLRLLTRPAAIARPVPAAQPD